MLFCFLTGAPTLVNISLSVFTCRAHSEPAKSATVGFRQLQTTWKVFWQQRSIFTCKLSNNFGYFANNDWQTLFGLLFLCIFFLFCIFEILRFDFSLKTGSNDVHYFETNIFLVMTKKSETAINLAFDNRMQIILHRFIKTLEHTSFHNTNLFSFTAGNRDRELLLTSDNSHYLEIYINTFNRFPTDISFCGIILFDSIIKFIAELQVCADLQGHDRVVLIWNLIWNMNFYGVHDWTFNFSGLNWNLNSCENKPAQSVEYCF